jgi:hypothetical protein
VNVSRVAVPPGGPAGRTGPSTSPAPRQGAAVATDVVVLIVVDFAPGSLLWGWSRLVRGPAALRGTPGLRFARVLGSGQDGRFGLRPSRSVQGLFAVFADEPSATAFLDHDARVAAYRRRAREFAALVLRPISARGSWGGQTIAASAEASAPAAPLAALTRASIRPLRAMRFWRHAPPSQADLETARGCRFAVGLGEAPLLRQATFSLWDDVESMQAYAHSGAHLGAIRAAYDGGFFSETMFVRFVPLRLQGRWHGRALDADG